MNDNVLHASGVHSSPEGCQEISPEWSAATLGVPLAPRATFLRRSAAAIGCALLVCMPHFAVPVRQAPPQPVFHRDVVPILQERCQSCHRPGEIAPMPLITYEQVRPWAKAMKDAVLKRTMPPWFADPRHGKFSNDPSLSDEQIRTITSWVDAGAPAGDPRQAPPPKLWPQGWNIAQPDHVVRMAAPVDIPPRGDVEYTYQIIPTNFKEDRWVQTSEIRPSSRMHVHHAVVYIRPPESKWLRKAPVNVPFTASTLTDPDAQRDARWTDSDILLIYAPGSAPDVWPAGMAKLIPAGSDLVFQMHYTTNGRASRDQTGIGMSFATQVPAQRVVTLQLTNSRFSIPPHADDYRVEAWGTLPNDATLLSFFPHMHIRGKRFEYNIVQDRGRIETLLRVNYDFFWQLTYRLAQPRPLKAGTRLQALAWYDNSRNNHHNPDPDRIVTWGDQTSDEMMVGFFDVAVPSSMDKWQFFIREGNVK